MDILRFKMVGIKIRQFAILAETPPAEDITYRVGIGTQYSVEAHRIGIDFSCQFEHNESRFIVFDMFCEFEIHPNDWNGAINDGRIVISKPMLEYFASQTVGAARGILYCKTEGTPFSHFFIPPINITNFIKEDLSITI